MSKRRNSERVYITRDPGLAVMQEIALAQLFGCVRVVTNDSIAARRQAHALGLPYPSYETLAKQLITEAKQTKEREWLGDVSAVPLQSALRDATQAYKNFFDSISGKRKGPKMGLPRFKRKNGRQTARFTRNARYKIRKANRNHYLLSLPGVPGELQIKCSRPIPDDPSSVTLIRDPDGRLFASFCHEVDEAELDAQKKPPVTGVTGIDLGLVDYTSEVRVDSEAPIPLAIATRGKQPNPRLYRRKQKKLAKAQRQLSRKQKGSNNRKKAKLEVAKLHRQVRETRLHLQRTLARRICHENQVICVETLAVLGLCKAGAKGAAGRGLRKSVHDAAWAQFLAQLSYYADLWGRTVVPIGRFEPTSQVCCVCGVRDGKKDLSVRVWECSHCGALLDRDYNAAVNIMLAAGLAESLNACGQDVRRFLGGADLETLNQFLVQTETGTSPVSNGQAPQLATA